MDRIETELRQNNKEIVFPRDRFLRHFLRDQSEGTDQIRFKAIPANSEEPPIFRSSYYLANVASDVEPILLDLRFVPTDQDFYIALLMTNERYPKDIEVLSREILRRVRERGIEIDGVIGPESLGSPLVREIGRQLGGETPVTTLQKGKAHYDEAGGIFGINPPKAWIGQASGIEVSSGTSHPNARQRLFIDPRIAETWAQRAYRTLVVDDARLSSGTLHSSIKLLERLGINIAACATVLNEADLTDQVMGIPYVSLTELPVFDRVEDGFRPRVGSYEGLNYFYVEQT